MELITKRIPLENTNLPDWAAKAMKEAGVNPEGAELVRKGLVPSDTQFKENENASVDYITTKARDRDNELVVPKGIELGDYRKHPVVLYCHNYRPDDVPPGRNMWIKLDDKGLVAKTEYFVGDESSIGHKIYNYRKAGFPMAKSIGFIPIEQVEEADFKNLDLKALDLNEKDLEGVKRVYPRSLLLEYSDVPVPSNPDALQLAVSKGLFLDIDDAKKSANEDDAFVIEIVEDNNEKKGRTLIRNETPGEEGTIEIDMTDTVTVSKDEMTAVVEKVTEEVAEKIEGIGVDQPLGVLKVDDEPEKVNCPDCDFEYASDGEEDECPKCGSKKPPRKSNKEEKPEGEYYCKCPDCGYKGLSATVCSTSDCPECGKKMTDGAEGEEKPEEEKKYFNPLKAKTFNYENDVDEEKNVRWNPTLSKEFDIAEEPLEASTVEYGLIQKFLGCEMKNISETTITIPSVSIGNYLSGLKVAVKDWEVQDVRNIGYDGTERPPARSVIQLNSKISEEFLIEGTIFYKAYKEKEANEIEIEKIPIVMKRRPSWGGLVLTMFVEHKHIGVYYKAMNIVHKWIEENNWLKGERFSLSGQFIEKTDHNWDDVFLTEKNIKALQLSLRSLEKKKQHAPNRGLLLIGPPGTGKTLSGRIMANVLDDVTFIWISARDFYRSGAAGGIGFGFDMARKLAPSILFVEDIDNWLHARATDLLKTEMDGLKQSTGVVTMLTSNYPETLPDALIDRPGRFHDVLNFDLPDSDIRSKMIQKWTGGQVVEKDLDGFVSETIGYSGAHIYELVAFAKSLMEDDEELEMPEAVRMSLRKIEEQRELISNVRGEKKELVEHLVEIDKNVESDTTFYIIDEEGKIKAPQEDFVELDFINKDDNQIIELTDDLVEKAGRVISAKNRKTIQSAIDGMDQATLALKALMSATELSEEDDSGPAVDISRDIDVKRILKTVKESLTEAQKENLKDLKSSVSGMIDERLDVARGRVIRRRS